ncbi:unnamed protein product [Zymoseptoria tritici ST99CH_1E4]|uniref:Uncharacterized protein n=1 Tax=Zymoseptoria tritici ST99CH_1E4 TaxID=1276532 RepID=A0A2H1GZ74_ZYMTR|nr:unnamed protein product [Zymoseptoria tritici ST99CH_1E4]
MPISIQTIFKVCSGGFARVEEKSHSQIAAQAPAVAEVVVVSAVIEKKPAASQARFLELNRQFGEELEVIKVLLKAQEEEWREQENLPDMGEKMAGMEKEEKEKKKEERDGKDEE